MMIGMPIVAPATTEIPTVIASGVNGFIHTDRKALEQAMAALLRDPALAREWGEAARRTALERFHIERFVRDWCAALAEVTDTKRAALAA
jgi:glycosyltransferase involved in cell wall biosynthesis